MEYRPYVYKIGWSNHNTFYIGCQYGWKTKIANPQNLWQTYFTSSERVTNFKSVYGEPDIFEILFVLEEYKNKPDGAKFICEEEIRLLKEYKAKTDPKYLNASDSLSFVANDEISNLKRSETQHRKYTKDPSYKAKISEGLKRAYQKDTTISARVLETKIRNGTLRHSAEAKMKMQKSAKIRANTAEGRMNMKKAAIKMQENMTEEQKTKRSEMTSKRFKGIKKKQIACPHCDKIGAPNVMSRWHFDNCKLLEYKLLSGF